MADEIDLYGAMRRVALLLNILRDRANENFTLVGPVDARHYRLSQMEGDELIALIRMTNEFALDCVSEAH